MTITISNSNVADNAPLGTVIGALTVTDGSGNIIPCNFMLTKRSAGHFGVSGNNLLTIFTGPITPGCYSLRVRANGIYTRYKDSATFTITVTVPQPTPPTPTGITFNPSTAALTDDAGAGSFVAATSVSMSDGSVFSGALAASPTETVAISGNTDLVLARNLQPADDGPQQWTVGATQNGVTVSSSIQAQVAPGAPRPTGITFAPTAASLPDNAGAGTTIATVSVSMSKGPGFSGSLTASPTGIVTMSGKKLVLARGLTAADDGAHPWSVAATQNGVAVSGTIQVQVNPTPTGVTFTPTTASLPDNAATGSMVATVSVAMSNGSGFAGSLTASPAGTVTMSGNKVVLARGLTSADNGSYQWSVAATQNGVTVSGSISVQITAMPTAVTFTPSAPSLPDNAVAGSTVAVVAVKMSDGSAFAGSLAASPAGTVTISGNKLVLARGLTSADDGAHPWSVVATQNGLTVSGTISVQVTPTPTSISFIPSTASLPDNASAATTVAAVSVAMSDGSAFAGGLAASPAGTVTVSGNKLVLVRGLTTVDDGAHQWSVSATQNSETVSGAIQVQVTAASPPPPPPSPPYPTAISVTPAYLTIADSAPAGTLLATAAVTMSDGSQFTGALTTRDTSFFAISGLNIVSARALTSADDGPHTTVITAHQGNQSLSARLSI
jgi:hypothetical protein